MRLLLFLLCIASTPARACEVALVLAVDVSGSVDPDEYRVQMDGLAAALDHPSVSEALVAAKARVMLIQWTGSNRQAVTIDWTEMSDFVAVRAFADAVANDPREWRNFSTAIGEAIELSLAALEDPIVAQCERHVIDVSGDGPSNEGILPQDIRSVAQVRGVTINALAIEVNEVGLADYFRKNVIVGEGAFALRAATFDDYPDRIRAKLIREVTKQVAWVLP